VGNTSEQSRKRGRARYQRLEEKESGDWEPSVPIAASIAGAGRISSCSESGSRRRSLIGRGEPLLA
jgi:hypothetical protein